MAKKETDTAAAEQAAAEEKTEEQVWAELQAEEAGKQKDEPEEEPGSYRVVGDEPEEAEEDTPSEEEPDEPEATEETPDGTNPEALKAQIERLQHSLDSEKGRTAAARREIERLNSDIAAAQKKAARKGDDDDDTLKAKREQLAKAREEYGDVIGPLADQIDAMEDRLEDLGQRETAHLEQMKAHHAQLIAEQWDVFTEEHPDGVKTIHDNQAVFDAWIDDQPKRLRDIYAANSKEIVNGQEAALLVSLFQQALSTADGGSAPANNEDERLRSRREKQLSGAKSIKGPTTRQATTPAPDPNDPDEQVHWNYFKRMEERVSRR